MMSLHRDPIGEHGGGSLPGLSREKENAPLVPFFFLDPKDIKS